MLHRLLFLWPCLLLVCCDKQGPADARSEEVKAATTPRRGHRTGSVATEAPKFQRSPMDAVDALVPEARDEALATIAWDAMELDPELAHQAFHKMSPDHPARIRLIRHYAMRLAMQNPDEAIEWSETLGSETETAAAITQVAVALAEADPQRAANLLSDAAIPGRDFEVAIVQVIQRWAAQSAPDAAEWVSLFPAGAAREAGIQVIAERWLAKDAAAAFVWLDQMSDMQLRRETARAMEGVILQQSPATREAWLQHATAPIRTELEDQREPALQNVGNNLEASRN